MAGSQNTTTLPGGGHPASTLLDRVREIRRTKARVPLPDVLRKLQGGRCFYCLTCISNRSHVPGQRNGGWTRDHVHPRASGAGNAGNVVLACYACNQRKGDRLPTALELAAARQIWAAVLVTKPDMLPTVRRSAVLH
ncbi:HNH endonuclease [Azospirillum sp. sgz301742]